MKTGLHPLLETDRSALADHLLKLGPEDRRSRFFACVGDSFVRRVAACCDLSLMHGLFEAGQLVGAAHLAAGDEDGHFEFSVSVDPEQRGRGWARRMLVRSLNLAADAGAPGVIVRHDRSNLAMAAVLKGLPTSAIQPLAGETGLRITPRALPLNF